jgi:hypothetical protein
LYMLDLNDQLHSFSNGICLDLHHINHQLK